MITHAGWKPPWYRMHDTLTMAHLTDPLRPKGLKPLAVRLIDRKADGGQKALAEGMKANGWNWGTVPYNFPAYWAYSALDPVLTCRIYEQLAPAVTVGYKPVYDLEQAVTRILTGMMLRGVRVDVPYIHEAIARLRAYALQGRAWLASQHAVNSPMSARQVSAALDALGVPTVFWTPTGQPQMDKDALAIYDQIEDPAVHDLIRQVLGVRKAEKLVGSYLENFLEFRDSDDILRCTIWALGTRTGRMSITDPAMQTLPALDTIVRGAIIPRDGYVLISVDAAQIEMRLAAHFSGDEGLIKAFHDSDQPGADDFFTLVARDLFRAPGLTKDDPRRKITKNVGYAKLYGAGTGRMAATAKLPIADVQPVHDAFNARYPGLKAMTEDVVRQAREHNPPCVWTPLGRRLVADQGHEYTQLPNARIQSHAGEILKKGIADLDAAGLGDNMLLPVHDELIFEVPREDANDAFRLIIDTLTDRVNYAVPILWDGKIMEERWVKG